MKNYKQLFYVVLFIFINKSFAQEQVTNLGDNSGVLGKANTFIGYNAGKNLTFETVEGKSKGVSNTFVGAYAGEFTEKANNNVFVGRKSGHNNLTGSNNLFLGNFSGENNGAGANNVYIGDSSGRNNVGSNNVFIGAISANNGITTNLTNKLIFQTREFNELIYGDFKEGYVGINTTDIPQGYKFAVGGKMIAQELKIALMTSEEWADYVFAPEYDLPTLQEAEAHIKEHGHLLDIPSAEEVEKNGILLGEMNAKLLQKIEELTLYTIEQEKELEAQEKELNHLKSLEQKNKELEARLERLEKLLNNN